MRRFSRLVRSSTAQKTLAREWQAGEPDEGGMRIDKPPVWGETPLQTLNFGLLHFFCHGVSPNVGA